MTETDRALVRAFQAGLPRVRRPFHDLAWRLGLGVDELLERLEAMQRDGRLRRLGAVVDQRRVGLQGNVMAVWRVEEERLDEVGRRLASRDEVTHAYVRPAGPDWPYRLYTMLHAESEAACEQLVHAWADELDVADVRLLPTVREWKKSPPVYFPDDA